MRLIEDISSVPEFDKKEFWDRVDNEELKSVLYFLIINELRSSDPEIMNENQLRAKMAKLKTYERMIDFKRIVKVEKDKNNSNQVENQDEL